MSAVLYIEGVWPSLLAALPAGFDLAAMARASGAFCRARGIKDAAALLRVALAYGGSDLSLREASAWAEAAGVAQVSDVALQKRLRRADSWLGQVLQALLAARLAAVEGIEAEAGPDGRRCMAVDATSLCEPGADRKTWRLHVGYDLRRGGAVQVALTDIHGGESLRRFTFRLGDPAIADRGYARPGDLRGVVEAGADLLVRLGWNSLRLLKPDGTLFDLFEALAAIAGEDGEAAVCVDERKPGAQPGAPGPVWRLVMHRKTPEQARVSQDEVRRTAKKRGRAPDARSLEAARYVILLTSLPREGCPAPAIASLYRMRWQIELAFKRWKGLGGLAGLHAKNPNLARAWVYARLIVALLAEQASRAGPAFPPCTPNPSDAGPSDAGPSTPGQAAAPAVPLAHRKARPRRRPQRSARTRPVDPHPAQPQGAAPTGRTTTAPNTPNAQHAMLKLAPMTRPSPGGRGSRRRRPLAGRRRAR